MRNRDPLDSRNVVKGEWKAHGLAARPDSFLSHPSVYRRRVFSAPLQARPNRRTTSDSSMTVHEAAWPVVSLPHVSADVRKNADARHWRLWPPRGGGRIADVLSVVSLVSRQCSMSLNDDENTKAKEAWDVNAAFWDAQMGEGNDFFDVLLWPSVERLLQPKPRERLLDVACGNGLTSRRLANVGASVTAFDGSAAMIALAGRRSGPSNIDYRVVDATDRESLLGLGAAGFDGALCNMALMDMADIKTLMTALIVLLKPGGRFVFSVLHPCFNNPATVQMGELEDRDGTIVTTYSVKVARYKTPFTQLGIAMHGQPKPHPYFHRPLSSLLAPALAAGLMLDGIEEQAFPAENAGGSTPLSWNGRFSEIPAALIARLRRTT